MQSTWENLVEMDLSESGTASLTCANLVRWADLASSSIPHWATASPMRPFLSARNRRGSIRAHRYQVESHPYRTSEANYLLALALLREGDQVAFEVPLYMQYHARPQSLGARVNRFRLRIDQNWEPDWEEFGLAVNSCAARSTSPIPTIPPNCPALRLKPCTIVRRCEQVGAWLVADEVYLGA